LGREEESMSKRSILACVALACFAFIPALDQQKQNQKARQEERTDYYKKWTEQDVKYIITDEEKAVLENLTTDEERENFVESFWKNRDPDERTPTNEFKEEHYRRIAYANEHFTSGIPGWMTDRGRIYIIHGKPDEIEAHPSGGQYQRPYYEGGGQTATYPFEIWWYRHLPGVGDDIELQFVDRSQSGEYRLTMDPEEKDALLHVPGAGLKDDEIWGGRDKKDRAYFNPGNRDLEQRRAKDNPFERYETYAKVQRAPEIRYKELKEAVSIAVSYAQLPFQLRQDFVRLNERTILVPLTLEVENKQLTFKEENGVRNARLAIYGIVKNLSNRFVLEFDDDLLTSAKVDQPAFSIQGRSVYQKVIALDQGTRYRLDLVVKDLDSGRVGIQTIAITPPPIDSNKLRTSSLILSDHAERLPGIPERDEMFVLGDVKIRPSVNHRFTAGKALAAYLQLYNAALDQSSLAPALSVTYRITREEKTVLEWREESGESIEFFGSTRVVLLKNLRTNLLEPGRYSLTIEARDLISSQTAVVSQVFDLL
jgi:GWxTD domain-containing protein